MMGKSHRQHKRLSSQGGLQDRHAAIDERRINSVQWSFADLQAIGCAIW
jgi:hypothetical protein